jgi:hypothetical protein
MTWKELKALGIHRCCACFTNGKQCRRRAVYEPDKDNNHDYCAKHSYIGPMISSIKKRVIEGMKIKRK